MPYLIGIFTKRKGKLVCVDITKTVYDDLQACKIVCDEMLATDEADYEAAMVNYQQQLEAFVMDETTEDTEPVEPHFTRYSYVPQVFTDAQIKELP
jgi:hypothetical protein